MGSVVLLSARGSGALGLLVESSLPAGVVVADVAMPVAVDDVQNKHMRPQNIMQRNICDLPVRGVFVDLSAKPRTVVCRMGLKFTVYVFCPQRV